MRATQAGLIAGIVMAALGLSGKAVPAGAEAGAERPPQVGLVVALGPGRVEQACVPYEAGMTGYDVLARSPLGASLVVDASNAGLAVCAIDGVGCPASNCFCGFDGQRSFSWSYWYRGGEQWVFAQRGAGARRAEPSGVEGWAWSEGVDAGGVEPPDRPFARVCGNGVSLPLLVRS